MQLLNLAKPLVALIAAVALLGAATEASADELPPGQPAAITSTVGQSGARQSPEPPAGGQSIGGPPAAEQPSATSTTGPLPPAGSSARAPGIGAPVAVQEPVAQLASGGAAGGGSVDPASGEAAGGGSVEPASGDAAAGGSVEPASGDAAGGGSVDPASGATESNTTTQKITQVQVSSCLAHCRGDRQVQSASQQNNTVQVIQAPPTGAEDGGNSLRPEPAPGAGSGAQNVPGVTQVQLGCLGHCFGTTTLDASSVGLSLETVQQLLADLTLPSLPRLTPAPGTLQIISDQTSYQSESGQGSAAEQSQVAAQVDSATQVTDTPAAPETGARSGARLTAVNQTTQGIWQLQVGCVFYCVGTQQAQQAQQSNTTVQATDQLNTSSDVVTPAVVNTVASLIWQVQVGCLFWCYDAVESQTAASSQSDFLIPAAPGAPAAPAAPPAPAAPAAPAAPPSPASDQSGGRSNAAGQPTPSPLQLREPTPSSRVASSNSSIGAGLPDRVGSPRSSGCLPTSSCSAAAGPTPVPLDSPAIASGSLPAVAQARPGSVQKQSLLSPVGAIRVKPLAAGALLRRNAVRRGPRAGLGPFPEPAPVLATADRSQPEPARRRAPTAASAGPPTGRVSGLLWPEAPAAALGGVAVALLLTLGIRRREETPRPIRDR